MGVEFSCPTLILLLTASVPPRWNREDSAAAAVGGSAESSGAATPAAASLRVSRRLKGLFIEQSPGWGVWSWMRHGFSSRILGPSVFPERSPRRVGYCPPRSSRPRACTRRVGFSDDAAVSASAERAASVARPSSGHQDREARVVQRGARDAAEYQFVQAGVPVGTHYEEIRAERGRLRQQETAHVFAAGRQASYFHSRTVTRQVARDVRSRLLAVIRPVALRVDDQYLDRRGPHKQRQGVRHGPDGLAPRVPPDQDAADPGCRAAWREHDDRSSGGQDEGLHQAGRAGGLAGGVRAGNHRQVRVACVHPRVAAEVRHRSPLRPESVSTDDVVEPGSMVRFDVLDLCLTRLDHVRDARTANEHLRRGDGRRGPHEYSGEVRAVLQGEDAGEFHDACRLGLPIHEDDDFRYRVRVGGVIDQRYRGALCRVHGDAPFLTLTLGLGREFIHVCGYKRPSWTRRVRIVARCDCASRNAAGVVWTEWEPRTRSYLCGTAEPRTNSSRATAGDWPPAPAFCAPLARGADTVSVATARSATAILEIERFCMDPASEVPVDEWGWRQASRRGEVLLQWGVGFSEDADYSAIADRSASFPTSALLPRAGSPAGPLRYGPPESHGTAALGGGSSPATFLSSAVDPAHAPRAWT